MEIKAYDTFWQRRKLRGHGLQPILMEVLEMEEVIGTRDICKVRWHILNNTSIDYPKRKRRILYLMKEYHYTDDEPWGLKAKWYKDGQHH